MAVMMQAFYWDAPKLENQEGNWWNLIAERVEALGKSGFNALWLPPVSKASDHRSMGYDPYDYWDLGDFDQKGGVKTLWGNRAELEALALGAEDDPGHLDAFHLGELIAVAHDPEMVVERLAVVAAHDHRGAVERAVAGQHADEVGHALVVGAHARRVEVADALPIGVGGRR